LGLVPYREKVYNNLGNVLFKRGKNAEAIIHYQKALELKPDYSIVKGNLQKAMALRNGPRDVDRKIQ